ncbi:Protein of unknown function [Pyronema omphalodes CBS 100304]|uniref:Uncharacterized protein n=1 Tax=Pyronema omphalodes (strain CBS 100304) TaxID=1076935 RepID=U4KZD6_PYROM|nr:Protein of unknown function [Pyronema omphalodes CBS 100304]
MALQRFFCINSIGDSFIKYARIRLNEAIYFGH